MRIPFDDFVPTLEALAARFAKWFPNHADDVRQSAWLGALQARCGDGWVDDEHAVAAVKGEVIAYLKTDRQIPERIYVRYQEWKQDRVRRFPDSPKRMHIASELVRKATRQGVVEALDTAGYADPEREVMKLLADHFRHRTGA